MPIIQASSIFPPEVAILHQCLMRLYKHPTLSKVEGGRMLIYSTNPSHKEEKIPEVDQDLMRLCMNVCSNASLICEFETPYIEAVLHQMRRIFSSQVELNFTTPPAIVKTLIITNSEEKTIFKEYCAFAQADRWYELTLINV